MKNTYFQISASNKKIIMEQLDDKVVPRTARTLRDFKGYLKGKTAPTDSDVMRKKAKEYIGGKPH